MYTYIVLVKNKAAVFAPVDLKTLHHPWYFVKKAHNCLYVFRKPLLKKVDEVVQTEKWAQRTSFFSTSKLYSRCYYYLLPHKRCEKSSQKWKKLSNNNSVIAGSYKKHCKFWEKSVYQALLSSLASFWNTLVLSFLKFDVDYELTLALVNSRVKR